MSRKYIAPAIVALLTFLTFLPVLWNDFVDFDDYFNLVNNPHYRGLGWTQIRWAFTSSIVMGNFHPLTWFSFGFDYVLWGMNPTGYHLTNLLLHTANTVIFYFIARRLLGDELCAAFAALFWAIHPLRVESVAWATERRDVLSGFFFLLTIHSYLRARMGVALGAMFLSLLSKAWAITMPAVF